MLNTRKMYHCQLCQRKFSKPSTLKTHMYSHTGEKPFKCDYPHCDSKFSVLSNLRRHMKIHKKAHTGVTNRISPKERLYHVQQLIIRTQQQ